MFRLHTRIHHVGFLQSASTRFNTEDASSPHNADEKNSPRVPEVGVGRVGDAGTGDDVGKRYGRVARLATGDDIDEEIHRSLDVCLGAEPSEVATDEDVEIFSWKNRNMWGAWSNYEHILLPCLSLTMPCTSGGGEGRGGAIDRPTVFFYMPQTTEVTATLHPYAHRLFLRELPESR